MTYTGNMWQKSPRTRVVVLSGTACRHYHNKFCMLRQVCYTRYIKSSYFLLE